MKPGGCAVINALIKDTTFLGMFQPGHYYLFGRDEMAQRFAGWQVLEQVYQTFPAPENTREGVSDDSRPESLIQLYSESLPICRSCTRPSRTSAATAPTSA